MGVMRMQYFSYVLNPTVQGKLFSHARDKMDIFQEALPDIGAPLKFKGYGKTTIGLVLLRRIERFLIFRLGRGERIRIHHSPDEDFKEEWIEDWPSSYVFLNLDSSPKGHTIAFQHNPEVFPHPHVPLGYLAQELNRKLGDNGYVMAINPITTEQKFWDVVNKYEKEIQKVTFSFNAPNFLQLKTKLATAMKQLEKQYGATKVEISLENPAGNLKVPKTKLVTEGTEYIRRGQGSYSVKVKSRRSLVKEQDVVETVEIDVDLQSDNHDILVQTLERIFEKKDE